MAVSNCRQQVGAAAKDRGRCLNGGAGLSAAEGPI